MTMLAIPASPTLQARLRAHRSLVAPLIALLGAVVVRVFGWRGPDIPAQVYRVSLFRAHGWVIWDNGWYSGHYQLPYSVLFPPIGALIGLYGAAALSAAVAAWAFGKLVEGHFGQRSIAPAILFAIGTAGPVAIGQLPFLGGEAVGLLALLAARRGRPVAAVILAIACPLVSPVAGAFLMIALMAWALAMPRGGRAGLFSLVFLTAAPLLVLRVVFPSSGPFPFLGIDLALIVAICAIGFAWLPVEHRALRVGLVLYGLTAIAVFCVPNPIGGNLVRLTVSFGPALLVALASLYRRRVLLLLSVPLLVWQWIPATAAIIASNHNQSASVLAYYQPLIDELTRESKIGRVEIPFTSSHWEAAYVAPKVPLARGWERQLDMNDNPLFYDEGLLTPKSYREWLNESGVSWIALPDISLDFSARAEGKLIEADQKYLKLVWQNEHWRLWKVIGSPGMATGVASLVSLRPDQFVVDAAKVVANGPGKVVVGTTLRRDTHCPAPDSDG